MHIDENKRSKLTESPGTSCGKVGFSYTWFPGRLTHIGLIGSFWRPFRAHSATSLTKHVLTFNETTLPKVLFRQSLLKKVKLSGQCMNGRTTTAQFRVLRSPSIVMVCASAPKRPSLRDSKIHVSVISLIFAWCCMLNFNMRSKAKDYHPKLRSKKKINKK